MVDKLGASPMCNSDIFGPLKSQMQSQKVNLNAQKIKIISPHLRVTATTTKFPFFESKYQLS